MGKETLYLTTLGACRAHWKTEQELTFATDKIRALLVYLSLEPARAHRRDALAALLWSAWPDKEARRNLRQSLYRLKQSLTKLSPALGEGLLEMNRQHIQLNRDLLDTDVWRWQQSLEQAQQHEAGGHTIASTALRELTESISLHQGEFLAGLVIEHEPLFDDWLQAQRSLYRDQLTAALCQLAILHRERCEFEQSDQYLSRWLAIEPWNEEAHRERMWTLAMAGQRSAALAQYQLCETLLLETFQADPTDETIALYEQIHCEEVEVSHHKQPTQEETPPTTKVPLPPRPPIFLGRRDQLAEIQALLCAKETRILTVFGGGGSGKTTLCTELLHVLAKDQDAFPDGMFVISMVGLTRVEQLPSGLAQSLDLTNQATNDLAKHCCDYLRHRKALLYWDNFEHLLEGKEFLNQLQAAAPHVTHLIASRVPLGLGQEQRYQLQGLSTQDAAQLFEVWAHKVDPHFESTKEGEAILAICEAVAGLPLAVELAANWVQMLDCESIHLEMQQDLSLLHTEWSDFPEHHRSMQIIFEHTWNMLSPPQRQAFASLAVFRGSFDLKAAREITKTSMATLTVLWERALLQRPQKGRFALQQMLQHFAKGKLEELPDAAKYRDAHTRYYFGLLNAYKEGFVGQYPQRTQRILKVELDNIRMAWQRAGQQEEFVWMVDAADGLSQLYQAVGLYTESDHMFAQAEKAHKNAEHHDIVHHATFLIWRAASLAAMGQHERALSLLAGLPEEEALPAALNAERYRTEGHAHLIPGAYAEALTAFTHAKDFYAKAPNIRGLSDTNRQIGVVYWRKGDYEQMLATAEAGLTQDRITNYHKGIAATLGLIGHAFQGKSNFQKSLHFLQQSLAMSRELGDEAEEARCLGGIGIILRAMGTLEEALSHYEQAYQLNTALGLSLRANADMSNIGVVHWQMGRLDDALSCFQKVLSVQDEYGEQGRRGLTLGNIGKIYKDLGQVQPALACLEEALALERSLGHQKEEARVLGIMGEVYDVADDHEEARAHFEKAIALMRKNQYKSSLCWVLVACARVLHKSGLLEEAQRYNEEGFTIASQLQRKEIIDQSKALRAILDAAQSEGAGLPGAIEG